MVRLDLRTVLTGCTYDNSWDELNCWETAIFCVDIIVHVCIE